MLQTDVEGMGMHKLLRHVAMLRSIKDKSQGDCVTDRQKWMASMYPSAPNCTMCMGSVQHVLSKPHRN